VSTCGPYTGVFPVSPDSTVGAEIESDLSTVIGSFGASVS
jgi:hypothetical protein